MHTFERTYDPLTGIWTTIGAQDGKLVLKYDGDVSASLDHSKQLAASDDYTKVGIKKGWWHAFHIPPVIAMKMMVEDGFDVYSQPSQETFKFLRRNKEKYGHCLTTRGKF
jgi:hypothetical protein